MTGLRRGEICGLKWSDINFADGTLFVKRSVSHKKGGGVTVGETKTDASMRRILLPTSVATLLQEKRKHSVSEWIFPHYANPSEPLHPNSAYTKLKSLLSKANLPSIRFHDLRHTFATHAMQGGVDAKTLAGILGHTNASFTLNIYSHVTDTMRVQAAAKIDRKIGGVGESMPESKNKPSQTISGEFNGFFEPYKPKIRKSGTGCVTMINEHLYEGRYSPKVNGKRMARNVYAKTREECEEKLAELIKTMKAEIAELKKTTNKG